MAPPTQLPTPRTAIPEALRLQLDDFRRHLWRVKILEALAAGVIGLLFSFLIVYGLDRLIPTPGWARLAILLAGVSLFAGFAPYWLHRWVWKQRREEQLARLIARRYPGLGDRLLGVIELQDQSGTAESLSPRLREAAMEAVAVETGKRKLDEALPPQRHRRWALVATGAAALAIAAFILTPRAGWNALQRWAFPLSNTQRYTFTRLENAPDSMAVAFGEAFEINLQLSTDSEQRPATASGHYGMQPQVGAKLENSRYRFTFPGQQSPGVIHFSIGDLRHDIRVEPVQRPAVEGATVTVVSPSYLEIPDRKLSLSTGVVSVVEGSKIQVELQASRSLASANFGPTRSQVIDNSAESGPAYEPLQGAMEISAATARTPFLDVGALPFEMPFEWSDHLGLAGENGYRLRVDATRDAVPVCYLQGVDRQKVMLPEETIDFEVLAEDDYGVKRTGLEWKGEFTRPTDEAPAKGELDLGNGSPEERRIVRSASFSPAAFGITPQKILLRGYTEDYFPNRGRVYSEPVIVYVLTRDEHAQMLKSKFDRTLAEFEDLARRETNLLDDNQRLKDLSGEELQQEENARRVEAQEEAEAESQRRMQDLAERMENLTKDAARNGDIEKDTLKKMAEALKTMQELSKKDLPDVDQKLGDAHQQSNTPEQSGKDMAEAVEKQKQAVEKMMEALAKANDANKQFEAGTFINRLKKAAGEQEGIAGSLIEGYERILGVRSPKLMPSDQRRLREAGNQQATTASDVRWIQEDLASYFSRTKTETFKALLEEMKASEIDGGLEKVRSLLAANHSYLATEAARLWGAKLTEWAKKLEGEKDKAGGGGGGGGGGQSPEDEDFEFMLRVMKMIQQEQDLRSQTRALEQLRRAGATDQATLQKHREAAAQVADKQDELSADVEQLAIEQTAPQVIEMFKEVKRIMDESTDQLADAETGGITLAAQTDIIEKILAASKERQKQSGGAGAGAMMEMMERMAGETPEGDKQGKPGQQPGDQAGQGATGNSDAANTAGAGGAGGKNEARRIPKAGGTAGRMLPEEFQKALDAYNRGVEKKLK